MTAENPNYRWIILPLACLLMGVFALSLHILSPILSLFMHEHGITYSQAGMLMTLFAIPSVALSLLTGMLSDRYGPRSIGTLSIIFVTAGSAALAFSTSYPMACAARLLMGIGAAMISIISAQILSQWFIGRGEGTAMAIFNVVIPATSIIMFTTFGGLGERFGWRMPVHVTTIFCAVGLLLFILLYRDAPGIRERGKRGTERPPAKHRSRLRSVGPAMWLLGMGWMWYTAATIAFAVFAPDFLIQKGYTIGRAGFLVSLLMWCSLIISPMVGRFIDRYGRNELLIAVGGTIVAVGMYLMTVSDRHLLIILFMALGVAIVPTPTFAMPARILKKENLGLGYGILTMFIGFGMLFGPYLTGLIRDTLGGYDASFIFLAGISSLVSVTAFVLMRYMARNGKKG